MKRSYLIGDKFLYKEGDGWLLTEDGWVYYFINGIPSNHAHRTEEWNPALERTEEQGMIAFNRKPQILSSITKQWVNVTIK